MTSDPTLKRWYNKFNKEWFNDSLPELVLHWESCGGGETIGKTSQESYGLLITIDPAIKFCTSNAKFALLHEMCHVAIWPNVRHTAKWQNEMIRLVHLGAFKHLW